MSGGLRGGNGGIRTHVIINKEIKKKKKTGRKTKQNKKNEGKKGYK